MPLPGNGAIFKVNVCLFEQGVCAFEEVAGVTLGLETNDIIAYQSSVDVPRRYCWRENASSARRARGYE
jgi:hypothetical protein